jgi:nickel-type superoxide dismutase maturation protease
MANSMLKRAGWLIAATGILAAWGRWRPFLVAVEGESMAPGFEPGDWLVAVRPRQVRQGSVVILEHPERPGFEMIKRVTGLPGDVVGAVRLGPDQHWVLGERPEASTDSRWFGPVSRSAMRGVAVLRYWPPSRAMLVRHGSS